MSILWMDRNTINHGLFQIPLFSKSMFANFLRFTAAERRNTCDDGAPLIRRPRGEEPSPICMWVYHTIGIWPMTILHISHFFYTTTI